MLSDLLHATIGVLVMGPGVFGLGYASAALSDKISDWMDR